MSLPNENGSDPLPDAALDRLVDGRLDEAERRALLLSLDEERDGWRRCALAFLEDQAWRAALGEAAPVPKVIEHPPIAIRHPRPQARRLAVAASLLAATFAAGFATGGASRVGPQPLVAERKPTEAIAAAPGRPAEMPIRNVGWFDVVDGTDGESPPGRVPIYEGPGLDEKWLRDQPPSVPDYVRAQWERKGYQVEERRRLVSLDLEDGRRVEIPVDEVNVEFVGQRPL